MKIMSRATGFTLIELMVTLVLVGILIAAGVPGMRTLLNNMEARGNADQLASGFAYARQQAVSRSRDVSICASSDGNSCSGANDWSTGWLIFEDDEPLCRKASAETTLRVGELSNNMSLLGEAGDTCVTYDGFGVNKTVGNAEVAVTSSNGSISRVVEISSIGSMTIK